MKMSQMRKVSQMCNGLFSSFACVDQFGTDFSALIATYSVVFEDGKAFWLIGGFN